MNDRTALTGSSVLPAVTGPSAVVPPRGQLGESIVGAAVGEREGGTARPQRRQTDRRPDDRRRGFDGTISDFVWHTSLPDGFDRPRTRQSSGSGPVEAPATRSDRQLRVCGRRLIGSSTSAVWDAKSCRGPLESESPVLSQGGSPDSRTTPRQPDSAGLSEFGQRIPGERRENRIRSVLDRWAGITRARCKPHVSLGLASPDGTPSS